MAGLPEQVASAAPDARDDVPEVTGSNGAKLRRVAGIETSHVSETVPFNVDLWSCEEIPRRRDIRVAMAFTGVAFFALEEDAVRVPAMEPGDAPLCQPVCSDIFCSARFVREAELERALEPLQHQMELATLELCETQCHLKEEKMLRERAFSQLAELIRVEAGKLQQTVSKVGELKVEQMEATIVRKTDLTAERTSHEDSLRRQRQLEEKLRGEVAGGSAELQQLWRKTELLQSVASAERYTH